MNSKKNLIHRLLLPSVILFFSCENNKLNNQNLKWISDQDTIATKIIFSYKYPQIFHKDWIQNGICFGQPTQKNEEFSNTMNLCVWFNDEQLENIDTIINSEGRFPFITQTIKENTTIDNKNALRVKYINDKKVIIKQIVLLKYRETLYQITANNFDSTDFAYFLNNIKIKYKL